MGGSGGLNESGDDRLSRQRHYHGPGGLNGRVRDGNGCGPAGMVAGKAAGGRVRPRRSRSIRWSVTHAIAFAGIESRCVAVAWHRPAWTLVARTGVVALGIAAGCVTAAVRPAPRGGGGGGSGWSSRSAVRTGRLRRSPAVHVPAYRPGRLPGAFVAMRYWKPGLGGGFALRCLQRLSGPDLATRRCPERDSRHTRGRSSPILSY